MDLFKRILIPIDFTDCAINAMQEADKLHEKHGGKLTIFHVIDSLSTPQKIVDEVEKETKNRMLELCEKHELAADILIKRGIPAEEIVHTINDSDYSLVIMGTHKRHSFLAELVGTMALKVIQHAHVPVLVIPGDKTLRNIDHIAFATDFKKIKDNSVLNYLQALCTSCHADLHLLNVNESPEKIDESEAIEALELHQYLSDVKHSFHFAREADPVDGITHYMDNNNIDLLALMPRNHGFFDTLFNDSVTDRLVLHLKVPLFSFHE